MYNKLLLYKSVYINDNNMATSVTGIMRKRGDENQA